MTQALTPGTTEPHDERLRLAATERQLVHEFGPALGDEQVRSHVREIAHRYADAPVRAFLAVLVEREARAQLRSTDPAVGTGATA